MSIVLAIAISFFLITINPDIVEAKEKDDIVGTWIHTRVEIGGGVNTYGDTYYIALQFTKDNRLIVYNEDARGDTFDEKVVEYSYEYDGNTLKVDGLKCFCSIVGNGMIIDIMNNPDITVFVRA